MKYILEIFILAVILLGIDMIYLKLSSKHFKTQVKKIQSAELKLNYKYAIMAYVLLVLGLYYFIIVKDNNALEAGLLGLVIYGVFDGTNGAILKDWDLKTVLIDTPWGGILFALTTVIYRFISNLLNI